MLRPSERPQPTPFSLGTQLIRASLKLVILFAALIPLFIATEVSLPLVKTDPAAAIDLTSGWKFYTVQSGTPPNDSSGRIWTDPAYDDSAWTDKSIPHDGGITRTWIGYYRFHFDLLGPPPPLSIWPQSDDGLALYFNGTSVGSWGSRTAWG